MFRGGKVLLLVAAIVQVCTWLSPAGADDDRLAGVVIGRTGEVLHISVPQPVKKDAVFAVKLIDSGDAIAEARVLSCTRERPYIALAKVVRGDIEQPVPIGVHAYAEADSIGNGAYVPEPMQSEKLSDDRFSLQAGAFYPSEPVLRDTVAEFWQAYRLNYSMLRTSDFDLQLSAEYTKGSSEYMQGGLAGRRTMQVIPVTVLGRFGVARMGGAKLFLAAGGGVYEIRSENELGDVATSSKENKSGREFAAGFESERGWIMELRYREVPDTEVKGYSLAFGARF